MFARFWHFVQKLILYEDKVKIEDICHAPCCCSKWCKTLKGFFGRCLEKFALTLFVIYLRKRDKNREEEDCIRKTVKEKFCHDNDSIWWNRERETSINYAPKHTLVETANSKLNMKRKRERERGTERTRKRNVCILCIRVLKSIRKTLSTYSIHPHTHEICTRHNWMYHVLLMNNQASWMGCWDDINSV